MKNFIEKAKTKINALLLNRNAASLWEYLLVIAIVCIIGAVLIAAIRGSSGIGALWQKLMLKFDEVLFPTT